MKVAGDAPEIRAEEDGFTGVRGLRIHTRTWLPAGPPAGVVVIAHGFAEHGGRYAAVAARLVAGDIAVRAADHRGHGLSEGRRTSVVRFEDYVDDLTTVIAQARARWPSSRLVLLGHSMGGLIALDLAVRPASAVDGLVLSAPAACPREVSRFTLAAGRALSRVAPHTGVLRLPLNRISRDPAVVDAYNNDPLVFRTPIRARLGAEMLDAMARVDAGLASLRTPLLVMQGTADGLVDPGCGPHVYDRAGSPDKTLKMYDGLWHEIFNEPERDHVLGDLTAWLRSHLGDRVAAAVD
ncbi:MAG TPA: lysophospholipase [Candidatus Saccharimonadales bacterium]|nr:lysophospholipase [Candidatus Saccharimonadales bacterium]